MSSIFLSHNNADKPFARRLTKDLELENIRVWLDEAELDVGDSLYEKIQNAIGEMEYLGVVLSPNSVESKWVKKEVHMALNEEMNGGKVKVLPLLIQDCELPGFLTEKLYADFRSDDRYTDELTKLIGSIKNRKSQQNKVLRVATHQARFVHDQTHDYYFINITNISEKPIEITHVWYDYNGHEVYVLHDLRRLPKRLEVNQVWETWVSVDEIPEADRAIAFDKFKVKVSTGDKFISKRDNNVPRYGAVPGGPDLTDMYNKKMTSSQ